MNDTMGKNIKDYPKLGDLLEDHHFAAEPESTYDYIRIADHGIKAVALSNIRDFCQLPKSDLAQILNISPSTQYRWIKENRTLDRNSSIKLLELYDLFRYGMDIFEDIPTFLKWLRLPNQALGGMEPMTLLEIPEGISKVRDLIGRIEYGVYS